MSDILILIGLIMFATGILVGVTTLIVFIIKKRKNIGKPLLIWFIYLLLSFLIMYIGANLPIKEWTYDILEQEFGGIIETDCISVRDCLNLLSWEDYSVGGYIVDKHNGSALGYDVYSITISDDKDQTQEYNTISVSVTEYAYSQVQIGDFIYANGSYSGCYANSHQLSCNDEGESLYTEEVKNSTSIQEFIKKMKQIYEDTFFKTEGLIMQDGENYDGEPQYYLYPSAETYKEEKYARIELEFDEIQYNLSGKTVVIIGKPIHETFGQKLCECSIVKEK